MSQVVINFLQPTAANGATPTTEVLSTDPRVFDFEISQNAQNYYQYELDQVLSGLNAEIVPNTGAAPVAITDATTLSQLTNGQIIFSGTAPTAAQVTQISNAINYLNNWSQMIQVNSSGYQTQAYGTSGTTLGAGLTVLQTDSNGNLEYPDSNSSTGFSINPWADTTPPANTQYITYTNAQKQPLNPPILNFIPGDAAASGSSTLDTTMDQYMATAVDQLIRTMRAAGWDPIADPTGAASNAQAVLASLVGPNSAVFNLQSILTQAASAGAQASIIGQAVSTQSSSIQQVLMVDYVSTGNQILFNEMQQLQSAVNINQQALSYLNSLQDLMNQKSPQQFIMQLQDLNNVNINSSNPQAQFTQFEQDSYNQSLQTISLIGAQNSAAYQAYFNQLAGGSASSTNPLAAGAFYSLQSATNKIANYSVHGILNNLSYLIQQVGAAGGSSAAGGLLNALNQVKDDFKGLVSANSTTALETWIQDTQASDPGGFQQDLSNAVTSSQSFNDTERENLREVMFVYEEFYKSASDMLNSLDTLIKKMADAISGH